MSFRLEASFEKTHIFEYNNKLMSERQEESLSGEVDKAGFMP